MNKKNKDKFVDDNHTIYNMNVEGFKWYDKNSKKDTVYVDKKEKRLIVKAAFMAYLPKLLIVLIGFSLAIVLLYFWLIL